MNNQYTPAFNQAVKTFFTVLLMLVSDTQAAIADETPATPQIPELEKTPPRYEPPLDTPPVTPVETPIKKPIETPAEPAADKKQTRQAISWLDSKPDKVKADWVQLVSGEWLRGAIISLHKDRLEFDSNKLDEQDIKLEDIKYLKSSRAYSLRFEDSSRLGHQTTGLLEINGDDVHVYNDYEDEHYRRENLISIASGEESELSYWKAKATLSLNIRRGNTNQTDFASQINATRRTTLSRLSFKYLGNFTSTENVETTNNHRINLNYDIFLNRRLFWSAIFSEYFRDPFQNIDYRILAGSGLGYNLIDTSETEWQISGGPGIKQTRFVTIETGRDEIENTPFLALKTEYSTELNSKVDLIGVYSINLANEASGGYTHHAIGTVETELTDLLDFDVSLVWDRIQYPAKTASGITPDKDDFKLLVGLSFEI